MRQMEASNLYFYIPMCLLSINLIDFSCNYVSKFSTTYLELRCLPNKDMYHPKLGETCEISREDKVSPNSGLSFPIYKFSVALDPYSLFPVLEIEISVHKREGLGHEGGWVERATQSVSLLTCVQSQ